ncbi:uncharacterized protein BO95DRAFT_201064 [Aspergillus brunneoviolaceus CBS 621.78]|uniref:Uncharacterized protein n=1 Tax=Aspergillus brunneoviolaceus CBS 621.78 TaxID=1450534 RepID=A0ACD1G3L4_9EURO|nr:hypothetical protein BO95DRAFT_201064 [Aspergillus brunneoviolaceus CBS 621.78]RAH43857.1 hypothetical protein BO95DRAFT_201064 [Aspergillus brunneoviolaceus CBS 621.78]
MHVCMYVCMYVCTAVLGLSVAVVISSDSRSANGWVDSDAWQIQQRDSVSRCTVYAHILLLSKVVSCVIVQPQEGSRFSPVRVDPVWSSVVGGGPPPG